MSYAKRARWKGPADELILHQVAFAVPPQDFDAAPTDFLSIAPETVGCTEGCSTRRPSSIR